MHKLLLGTLITFSSIAYPHDTIQEAILNSDYETVAKEYNAQEIPENMQHAYWSLADDTAKMRSNNLAFNWANAFVSKKLIISFLIVRSSRNIGNWLNCSTYPNPNAEFVHTTIHYAAWAALLWALYDDYTYYHQLHDKIKDAERIKFLIMAQS